jgi:hypothetical protein
VSISIGRTFNPKTNAGWEGTGVQPQVRAAAADALEVAHRLALSALIDRASDPAVRRELTWTRDAIDARRTPPAIDAAILRSYAGHYGPRIVSVGGGRLWYQRAAEAVKIAMTPLSASEFAMSEGQRVKFVASGDGVEMQMLMPDGTSVAYARAR